MPKPENIRGWKHKGHNTVDFTANLNVRIVVFLQFFIYSNSQFYFLVLIVDLETGKFRKIRQFTWHVRQFVRATRRQTRRKR